MSDGTISGIPRVDVASQSQWKRRLTWWLGGRLVFTKAGLTVQRKILAPLEAPIIKATRGRVKLSPTLPVVVLSSVGARSGQRREIPLAYFTDGDDVILIASNYGQERHPAWYHNLRANPDCELHIGARGGPFVAREVEGADRDRLYELAADRLTGVFSLHEQRAGSRKIPVMRLTPA
jgi:deazaflavin-dependent oxidoreductase (nitroreductase family)